MQPNRPQPFRLPQRFDSPTLAKLAIPGEPTVIVRAVGVGSTAPFEYSDRNGRQAIFRYEREYDAHVLKVPASVWNHNNGFMAHELMDQRRLPHPLVVTVEVPTAEATSPIKGLIDAMKADPEYAWGWHCNLAMAMHDSGAGPHQACNKGAALFLSLLSDGAVDTTQHPAYENTQGNIQPVRNRLTQHAVQELEALAREHAGEELTITPFIPSVLALVQAFAESGQSGGSAPFTAACITKTLDKLLAYKPLAPLTGEEAEWNDVSDIMGEPMWQNRRDSRVFKRADGTISFNDAIIWEEEDGNHITGRVAGFTSSQPITLPGSPSTRFVKVKRLPTEDPDDWKFEIADKAEEAELRALYPSSQGDLESSDPHKVASGGSIPPPDTTSAPSVADALGIEPMKADESPEMDAPGNSEEASDVVVGQVSEQPGASASFSGPGLTGDEEVTEEAIKAFSSFQVPTGNAPAPLYSRAWDKLESPMRLKELAAALETDPDTLKASIQEPLSTVELGHAGWVKRREPQA